MQIAEIAEADREKVRRVLEAAWGFPVVSISGVHDPSTLPGFVARDDGILLGVVTYRIDDGGCEVVTLDALRRGQGVGSELLAAVKEVADARGLRLWLVTTNDNLEALAFYQRRGMDIVALHRDFGDVVRAVKPGVRELGDGAVPLRHAFELQY